eukprot:3526596-Rhodomonas_salina.1
MHVARALMHVVRAPTHGASPEQPEAAVFPPLLEPLVHGLLKRMLEPSKKVRGERGERRRGERRGEGRGGGREEKGGGRGEERGGRRGKRGREEEGRGCVDVTWGFRVLRT